MVSGGMTYFPLKLNSSGVIPPIFASSLMMMPIQIGQWTDSAVVNDFVTNPGPSNEPLEEVEVEDAEEYGLMKNFVTRWKSRLPAVLASGAGSEIHIPPGNDELNEVMEEFFTAPYPARAAVGVAELPKLAQVEVEAILVFD